MTVGRRGSNQLLHSPLPIIFYIDAAYGELEDGQGAGGTLQRLPDRGSSPLQAYTLRKVS
jgi:hypothetical protein